MKCLIIDDEPLAIELLQTYIARIDSLVLIKSCNNVLEALPCLQNRQADLLFVDIQMPKITGLELIKALTYWPKIILTTAYRDYAVEAFDLDVADYLLKPITFERFLKSLGKVMGDQHAGQNQNEEIKLLHTYNESYIFLREEREMVKVFLKDIIYIESLRDYLRVKTTQKQIITYNKISYLEQKLPENKFIRVHRSFIIALEKVNTFSPAYIKLNDAIIIPIGRNYKSEAIKALNRFNILHSV
jgi:DNA-binding LytR/AlgR family response regulator